MRYKERISRLAKRITVLATLSGLALFLLTGVAFGQADDPYRPAVTQVDPPSWLEPFGPLASLPVWAIAALLAAVVAGLVIVVPAAVRWVWTAGTTRDSET